MALLLLLANLTLSQTGGIAVADPPPTQPHCADCGRHPGLEVGQRRRERSERVSHRSGEEARAGARAAARVRSRVFVRVNQSDHLCKRFARCQHGETETNTILSSS